MPRYRCFCQTEDGRVITGCLLEASDIVAAGHQAIERWAALPDFHLVEVWLGKRRLMQFARVMIEAAEPGPAQSEPEPFVLGRGE